MKSSSNSFAYWVVFILVSFAITGGLLHVSQAISAENDNYLSHIEEASALIRPSVHTTKPETKTSMETPVTAPHVTLVTSLGSIEIELFADKAPKAVANFMKLATSGFYDGTKFHRVIKDFMIQGGDPLSKENNKSMWGRGGPGYTFDDEVVAVPLTKGILAMANAGPNTNGSQFFIVTAASTPWLDGKHTPFGRVISGIDVVEKIQNTPVNHDAGDQPIADVVVSKVEVK